MLELLGLYKYYKENQNKNLEYQQYLERFNGGSGRGFNFLPASQLAILGIIIILMIYLYVFKSAWDCFTTIPPLPRIIVCLFCTSFWFIYLVLKHFNVVKCQN